ncbi:MAG TPA: PhzF family phenazine biosynthesis protein [Acidimicrobiales bacterium]|jgi:predicted PhzF superfamily epimerase YddE/YHI9/fatty acid desaturase|nr:PhzF family phenazine biosynthesis protein [Acidimicrobiales bacterium]
MWRLPYREHVTFALEIGSRSTMTHATHGVRRHQFTADVLADVRACSRSDNWHGPLEVVEHWTVVVAAAVMSLWAWHELPLALALGVYVVTAFLIGGRQRALAGVLHQACHRTLMSNVRAGTLVGAIGGGYPVLQSVSGYRWSHVLQHHGHFGDPVRDPDYDQYQRNRLCGASLKRSSLRRYLRGLIGPRATLAYIRYLVRHRVLTAGERADERCVRLAILASALIVGGVLGGVASLELVVLYWLVPLVTTQVWLGATAELLEHYPLIETAVPRTDIYMSWNRRYGRVERFLLGEKEGEGYHLVHHLFPRVPLWRLRDADEVLRRDPEYASLTRLGGIRTALPRVYRSIPAPPEVLAAAGRADGQRRSACSPGDAWLVDTFVDDWCQGNPAGVVVQSDDFASTTELQSIAASLGLPGTAFLVRIGPAHYRIRWFTPSTELPFCGHATAASAAYAFDVDGAGDLVRFESSTTNVRATRRGELVSLDLPCAELAPCTPMPHVVAAVGVPIVGWAKTCDDLILELESETAVRAATPNVEALAELKFDGHVLTAQAAEADVDFVSRTFLPRLGVTEDPVCVASHRGLAPYWAERLGRSSMSARQLSRRGGRLFMDVAAGRTQIAGRTAVRGPLPLNAITFSGAYR